MSPERQRVVELLKGEFELRQKRNTSYSLRAFARDLKTSPAILSMVFTGKRPVTLEKAVVWADSLRLSANTRQNLLQAVSVEQGLRADPVRRRARSLDEKLAYRELAADEFALISDWWHLGLLNLTKLKNFRTDIDWMAERLGISAEECTQAVERLERLGLLERTKNGLKRTARPLQTKSEVPSEAIRNFHRQNIKRAMNALDELPLAERDVSSIMVTGDRDRMEEAKRRIQLFRKELAAFMAEGAEGDEVYSLNIQLFPQTRKKS